MGRIQGCNYCRVDERNDNDNEPLSVVNMNIGDLTAKIYTDVDANNCSLKIFTDLEIEEDIVSIKIKYCPICGRYLVEEK